MHLPALLFLSVIAVCGIVRAERIDGILPAPGQVIDRDFVPLHVPRVVQGDSVGRVVFHVRYARYVTNKMDVSVVFDTVAVDSVPPFNAVWDCADVPDQDNKNLMFHYTILNTDGEAVDDGQSGDNVKPWKFYRWCVLDRSPDGPGVQWRCPPAGARITVDGSLDEWERGDSVTFVNNDNAVVARACWSRDTLYFGIRVDDPDVVPQPAADPKRTSYLRDGIELFLDPLFEREPYRDLDEVQQVVPVGAVPLYTLFPRGEEEIDRYNRTDLTPVISAVRPYAGGYMVELAFPWERLGTRPAPGKRIGVNLVNSDRDGLNGVIVTASWTGGSDLVNHNPSEWGVMVLTGSGMGIGTVVLIGAVVLLAGFGFVIVVSKRPEDPAPDRPARQLLFEQVCTHLQAEAGDESIAPESVAARFGCSAGYLHRLFKEFSDVPFSAYLTGLRIKAVLTLLEETDSPVTDVAYEAGFGSYRTCARAVKKATGFTPSEYRDRRRGVA